MQIRKPRKLLRSAKDLNWTNTTRVAIAPAYLTSRQNIISGPQEAAFRALLKYVEEQRLPRRHKGSKSLQDTSVEVVLRNFSKIDELGDFPKRLARRLWDVLNKRCSLSFHAWKILSKALHQEPDVTLGMLHYEEVIMIPNPLLLVYSRPLTSKSFDFITSLTIVVEFPVVDLLKLANISNLGILEIINPIGKKSNVEDILVRAWSREAVEKDAFTVLRILRLVNHPDVTEKSLCYISDFPALGVFEVRDCGMNDKERAARQARELGWVTTFNATILEMLESKCLVKSRSFLKQEKQDAHLPGRITEPLWDGSRVHRLDKADVQAYLTKSRSDADEERSMVTRPKSDFDTLDWPSYIIEVATGDEHWVSLNWKLFCGARDQETWAFRNACSWARMGELRNDADLVRAGVNGIEKQAFVGIQLVSPVPMAHICLGDRPITDQVNAGLTHGREDKSKAGLAFLRIGMGDLPKTVEDPKRKAQRTGQLRPIKKQNLGDILNGFQLG